MKLSKEELKKYKYKCPYCAVLMKSKLDLKIHIKYFCKNK